MQIESIRHAWPEKPGFVISRPKGHRFCTLLHFFGSVELLSEGEKVTTAPNACILYDAGAPQWFCSRRPLLHNWIHLSGDVLPFAERAGLPVNTLFYPSSPAFITPIVQELEAEFLTDRPLREILLAAKTEELFIKLGRSLSAPVYDGSGAGTAGAVRRVRGEIFSSLGTPWNITDMAKEAGISPSRFFTVYRSLYGTSPVDDLIRARIKSAEYALLYTDRTLSDIAESLGYHSLTHFMRQFRSFTGTTPGKFRRGETPDSEKKQ